MVAVSERAFRLLPALCLAAAATAGPVFAFGVIVVDAAGGGDHLTIQAAIDAADEGDLLLVRPGVYGAFTLAAKGLSIVAAEPGVRVEGPSTVVGIGATQTVLLSELEMNPATGSTALWIRDSSGHVRVQDCTFRGAEWVFTDSHDPAVRLTDVRRVAFTGCVVLGGPGYPAVGLGFPGQTALRLERSTAGVYGSEVRGGAGGEGLPFFTCEGGPGGIAVRVLSESFLYGSGGSFHGGPGGPGGWPCIPGSQGHSISMDPSAEAHLLGVSLFGGTYGSPTLLPGGARRLEVAAMGVEGDVVELVFTGNLAERVYLLPSGQPDFTYLLSAITGYLLVGQPFHGARYVGTIQPTNQLTVQLPLPKLQLGQSVRSLHLQAVFRASSGQYIASNGRVVTYLDDLVAMCLDGLDPGRNLEDCDGNGIPDVCDLALGIHSDCNGNGIPDVCDLFVRELSPMLSPIGFDSPQSWLVPAPPVAAGPVTIEVRAAADLAQQNQRIAVRVNGLEPGSVFSFGGSQCPGEPDVAQLFVPAADFNATVGGGDALIELLPSSTVDSQACTSPVSWAQIELRYEATTPPGDCNGDGIPDECQPMGDCNGNGIEDLCDIGAGTSLDCNGNAIPDECDLASGSSSDCNGNGIPDECDIASGLSTDVDGNGVPDECQQSPILYVDASQQGPVDGMSWASAFRDLQQALALAEVQSAPDVEIWVAAGEYRPAPPGGQRDLSFVVPARTALYGGFAGGETSLDQRDVAANPTILSGDLDGDDGPDFEGNVENSFHVVVLTPEAGVRLDGFTVRGGNANGGETAQRRGGAVLVQGSGPSIAHCTFIANSAIGGGGAAYFAGSLLVQGCTFQGNRALSSFGGGAIQSMGPGFDLADCEFVQNQAGAGGAVMMTGGIARRCRFEGNAVTGNGGGIQVGSGTLEDCHFQGNVASRGGGAYLSSSATAGVLRLTGCTFVGNVATSQGGGAWMVGGTVSACRFVGNEATTLGGGLYGSGLMRVVNALFHDNSASLGAGAYLASGGTGQRTIASCTFTRNAAATEGGGLFVAVNGVLVHNSVLWGNLGSGPDLERIQIAHSSSLAPELAFCDVQGLDQHSGNGNIDAHPSFADPFGPDGVPGTLDDDFRLLAGSPCVDSGSNALVPPDDFDLDGDGDALEPWPFDLDGNARIVDDPATPDTGPGRPPHVDRGAYERQ